MAMNLSLNSRSVSALLLCLFCFSGGAGCATFHSPNSRTLLGTATGSVIGAAIGKESGDPITGAVVGAIGGGLIGQAADNNRRLVAAADPSGRYPTGAQSGVTVDEVISLTASGVSKDLIQNQIRAKGFSGNLTTDQLLKLTQSKVDPEVIRLLQLGTGPSRNQGQGARPFPGYQPGPPVIYHSYPRRIYRPGYRCRPGHFGPGHCRDDFSLHIDL